MSPTKPSTAKVRQRVAAIVAHFPEGHTTPSGEHLSLEVRKRRFGWFLADHHGDGRLCINCKVPALVASQLQSSVPAQYHIPKYLGAKGWIGLWLDVPCGRPIEAAHRRTLRPSFEALAAGASRNSALLPRPPWASGAHDAGRCRRGLCES